MRAYLATTGTAFVLILLAHAARIVAEGWHVVMQPLFALSSVASLVMCAWAVALWRRTSGSETATRA